MFYPNTSQKYKLLILEVQDFPPKLHWFEWDENVIYMLIKEAPD